MWSFKSAVSTAYKKGVALGMLLALSPLLAAIAVAVFLDSGFPILFIQKRVGRGFRVFPMVKFRTMLRGRVTKVGTVLRRSRLDELPNLVNVMCGEMSLIGPRPEIPAFVERANPMWQYVLSVNPGVIDPASLAFRNEAEMGGDYRTQILPQKLALSAEYIGQRTMRGDLRILTAGAFVMIRGLVGS